MRSHVSSSAEADARDAVGRQAVLFAQLARGLDRRVRHVAGGMVLEEVVQDVEAARRLGQRIGRIEVGAVRAGEALGAFDHIGAAGEAALCQSCGEQAVIRRLAGMQRLAHRAEHRLQPRRLGARDAERGGELLRIQSQQMRARRGGAEAAEGAGGVEAKRVVVARARAAGRAGIAVRSRRRMRSARPALNCRAPRPARATPTAAPPTDGRSSPGSRHRSRAHATRRH